MMRSVKVFILLFCIMTAAAFSARAQETRTVTSEGVAAIQGDARDIARDAAIEDAQKRAVEQAIGILIDSQTQVENYQLISDKILSQTKGYITRYNIAGENTDSGLLRVRINAEVSLGKLTDDLSGIGILLGQMHKPRTMIMIAEQNIGHEWNAWWWGHSDQMDMGVVENTFIDVFTQKGFEFIDHAAAAREIKVTSAFRVQDLTAAQARTLGNQADAEVVIVGKALSKLYGEIGGGMKSVQADLSAKAIRTDTGQVIASATTHGAAVHITPETAGIDALRKASQSAADQMMEKILAVYSREAGGTRPVNITITGLNKTQFVKFKDVLRNQVRGIKDLHERSFNGGVAKISVDSKMSAQVLSDELSLKDFGDFTVEVMGSTANSLELRVLRKGMAPPPAPAPASTSVAPQPAVATAAAPAAEATTAPPAPVATAGYFEGDEYLVFDSDHDKSARAGKMLTPATPTHPEAEFLVFSGSDKVWKKHYKSIRQASPSELKVGARVYFFEGNSRQGVYFAPAEMSEARTESWWRDHVTDTSLMKSRGIISVGGYRVDVNNAFVEIK